MIILNPGAVKLGAVELANVTSVAIDRGARRSASEWTDLGPHAVYADVPEQRVTITIVRKLHATELVSAKPGELLGFVCRVSANASAAPSTVISAQVVVMSVEHSISAAGHAVQKLRAMAISSTGASDPITESMSEGEV